MYRVDTMFSFILLVFKMLQIPWTKNDPYFLKRLAFVTKKDFAQDVFGKCPMAFVQQQYANSYVYKLSY